MAVQIVQESYSTAGLPSVGSLTANAGDWVDASVNFTTQFQIGSGNTNKCTYFNQGNNTWLEFQSADFGEFGFLGGDVVTITFTYDVNNSPVQTFVRTVDYISGNQMYLTAPLGAVTTPPSGTVGSGTVFPTDGTVGAISIIADKLPEAIEFWFNLTPNGSNSLNSVIDGGIQRFEKIDTNGLTLGVPVSMDQLNDRSGGYVTDVELTWTSDPGGGYKDFTVNYKFWQWGVIQDGVDYYELQDNIAPIVQIKAFAVYQNANAVLIASSENTEANTGDYNENYNGGNNNYDVQSIAWTDSLGDPIDAPDYSGTSSFVAIVNAPNQDSAQSIYRIGLCWRPIDDTQYKNLPLSIVNNLMVVAPEVDFQDSAIPDPTTYPGFPTDSGAQWDFVDIQFELTGADELTVTGTVVPNGAAAALFAGVPDGGRKSTLWISLGNFNNTPTTDDRVSLTLFDEDNIDAPTKGVQIPNVLDQTLFDHAGNDITAVLPQTTTEDDVLYVSNFQLIQNIEYTGVRTRIFAFNTVTEEEFTLENLFFNFSDPSVGFINGIFEINQAEQRGFNLPPTTDRNEIRLEREPANDALPLYGMKLSYGYLSRWEYWLEQSNADNDFFDLNEPFNGRNKNWQRFSNSGDWIVRLSYYTNLDGVEDFNHQEVGIRPYEDDPNITNTRNFTVVSSGQTPNDFPENELIEVESIYTWTAGNFANPWVEETIENFESGNRWVVSSVLDQGGIAANPLKPIPSSTLIDLTIGPANVLTALYRVDSNLLNVSQVSISHRVYSDESPAYEYLITIEKEAEVAYSLRKVSSDNVYPDISPCIRVRRDHDDTELDIGFLNNEINVAQLLGFVNEFGLANGFVAKWYDQSGNGNHALQASLISQPRIVNNGVVEVDPDNGKRSVLWGLGGTPVSSFSLTFGIPTSQEFYQSWVFNRASAGIVSLALTSSPTPFPFTMWWPAANAIYSGMSGGTTLHESAQTQTGSFLYTQLRDNANDMKLWENSSALTTQTVVDVGTILSLWGNLTGQRHDGHVQELIYWAQDKESDRVFIESNTNNFYNIF